MPHAWPIDAATYGRHALHLDDRAWPESSCYVDLWVELLHSRGLEPLAVLPNMFAVDFEGDQWTFLKLPAADLYALYGVEVIELNVWRALVTHLEEQLALDRACIVDVDAFYLPDTASTSYHANHVKTSIAIQSLDVAERRLGYFHNAGYHELQGPDFAGVLGLERTDPSHLPPYVEVAKFRARAPHQGRALVCASLDLLRNQVNRRPYDNPFRRYAAGFAADLEVLAAAPFEHFHSYAFATFRQCGAAFELGGAYLGWLQGHGEVGLEPIVSTCAVIAITAKALQLRTARFVSARRYFDPAPMLDRMAEAWDETMTRLAARYGALAHHG